MCRIRFNLTRPCQQPLDKPLSDVYRLFVESKTVSKKIFSFMKARGIKVGTIGLLLMMMVSSSAHAFFVLFFADEEELKCYCCLNGESGASMKCACGCNNHNETDTSDLLTEAVPSRSYFIVFLAPCFGQTEFFLPPESAWIEVPTPPPEIV